MTTRWGIVGCGDVCEVKSGPAFQLARDSRLVAVMRRDAARARDYAERHGVERWYSSSAELINDPDVDAVYIATPPGSHLELALAVAAAGKPAYVEKPMARSHVECITMVDAFRARKLPLFVAFYRRGLGRFNKVRELVQAGAIGALTSVEYRFASAHRPRADEPLPWRLNAIESGGGLFMDLGCHTLDILDYILGPLEDVRGAAANRTGEFAVEDSVAMTFRTRDGALGVASWDFAGSESVDKIQFHGSEGTISLSTFGNEYVELRGGSIPTSFDIPNPPHIQLPLIQSIVDELHGEETCPSTGESGARTALVMDRVLTCYYGSRSDPFWLREDSWPGRSLAQGCR